MSEEYITTGSFANLSIGAFKGYVKNGTLDVEAVTKDYDLNERQIPHLRMELEAAGFLKDQPAKITKPLKPVEKKEPEA